MGGIIEVFATGLPAGLGTHAQWDRKIEARLGAALLSVQTIKGIEFGPAFENARKRGTEVQDPIIGMGTRSFRTSNRSGGIEGGTTNGQPLLIRAAMRPIATTLTPQPTVNLATGEEVESEYHRSDFCPVPRAVPILEAVTAFALADVILEKLGGDSLRGDDRCALATCVRFSSLICQWITLKGSGGQCERSIFLFMAHPGVGKSTIGRLLASR